MITDPVADLLTRIRNAVSADLDEVMTPHSQLREAILTILKAEGYIESYQSVEEDSHRMLRIHLAYAVEPGHGRERKINTIKRVSKPGRRVYTTHQNIPRPRQGLGTVILSTSSGILTGKDAKKRGLGGEVLCEVW